MNTTMSHTPKLTLYYYYSTQFVFVFVNALASYSHLLRIRTFFVFTPSSLGIMQADQIWKLKLAAKELDAEELSQGRSARRKERLARRRAKAKRRAEQRREAAERRAAEEWERSRQEALVKHASREMEWMEEEEEAKEVEKELFTHQANVKKLQLYGQSKGKEELRMRAVAKKERDHSNMCVEANEKAITWKARCLLVVEKRLKVKERLEKEVSRVASEASHKNKTCQAPSAKPYNTN